MFGAQEGAMAWTVLDHEAQDHQAQPGQIYKAGGCDSHLDRVWTMHGLQLSRAMAYRGPISPVKTKGCSSSEGTRARTCPLKDAGRDAMSVMESSNANLQYPGVGNWGKNTSLQPSIGRWKPNINRSLMLSHPSVGNFNRDGVNFFDFECAGYPRLESRTSERTPVARRQQCRCPALVGAGSRDVAASMY